MKKRLGAFFALNHHKNNEITNRSVVSGFTLIELMTVVATIGILVATSLAAYQDYTVPAKVTEGLIVASSLKNLMGENSVGGTADTAGGLFKGMPTNVAGTSFCAFGGIYSLNGLGVTIPVSKNASTIIGETATGSIAITFSATASNDIILLVPSSSTSALVAGSIPTGAIKWICYALGKAAINGATVNSATL